MRANFVERKKYSEDGEYSYSTNNFFQFAYEVVGDKLYMGLEALITDEEDENEAGVLCAWTARNGRNTLMASMDWI